MKKKVAAIAAIMVSGLLLAGCSEADTVSHNLSTDAEQFKIERRVVFYNGITDKYMLTIEGRCSIEPTSDTNGASRLEVTCKIGPDKYIKDYLGLSDNVTYFVEQQKPVDASVYHYKVILKPESLVPDFEVDAGKQ